MRRQVRPAVGLAIAAMLALTGCSHPVGGDGNLTNNWPAMPEPKVPVPVAPMCYAVIGDDPLDVTVSTATTPCEGSVTHSVETFHVGQFAGPDADRVSPPPAGGPEQRRAYEECAGTALQYLGDDWRGFRLGVSIAVPSALHWEAGARWFRCDVVEYVDLKDYHLAFRTVSLKGALNPTTTLGIGCQKQVNTADKTSMTMVATACTQPHNVEFAGVVDGPDQPFPVDDKAQQALGDKTCPAVIARFAGVPNDANLLYRAGWVSEIFARQDWELGNRGIRCYIWTEKDVTSSLKHGGTKALPVG